MKIEAIDFNSPFLDKVKKMGKENASTLGFLPEGAFDEHAKKRQILVAISNNNECIGYILYRVVNRQAKIAHLCVDRSSRNFGVAQKLIEQLKAETKDLLGISLKCRRDYEEATKLWGKCKFIPINESPGRGKSQSILVHWWFDHGHPTLFDIKSNTQNEEKIDVVADANVVFDLDDQSRIGYEESNALKADWLEDSLNICVVDELYREINRNSDAGIRRASREKAAQYKRLSCDTDQTESFYEEIKLFHPKEKEKLSERDKSDIRQLAEAISSEAQYFVTRDDVLLNDLSENIFNKFGLKILRPSDLVIQIDEIRREREYQPISLSGTKIKILLVKSGQEDFLTKTFQQDEKQASFKGRLRVCLSDLRNYVCKQVVDEYDDPLALFVYKKSNENYLEIPLLRVKKNRLSPTLARNLIIECLNNSIENSKTYLKITDTFINSEIKAGLVEEGFIESENGWIKFHLNLVLSRKDVADHLAKLIIEAKDLKEIISKISNVLNNDNLELNSSIFAHIEKLFYPIKITDSLLPCFIVPIQPQWAKELFDEGLANQVLFGAKRDLALRKEQVFYRKVRNSNGLRAPARILWYVSQGRTNYIDVGAIRACSMLDEVIIDKPKTVYNLFKRLGIYEWKHVYETANHDINNEIMALRFSNTQLFSNAVKFAKIEEITKKYNHSLQVFSPHKIKQEIFIEIYTEGTIKKNEDRY